MCITCIVGNSILTSFLSEHYTLNIKYHPKHFYNKYRCFRGTLGFQFTVVLCIITVAMQTLFYSPSCFCLWTLNYSTGVAVYVSSSLAKGFAHGPLSLHPWQIELDFVNRHLAVFAGLAYKDDITFDQCELLTISCLIDVKCLHLVFTFSTAYTHDVSMIDCQLRFDWTQLVEAAFNKNPELVDSKCQLNLPRVKKEGTVSDNLGQRRCLCLWTMHYFTGVAVYVYRHCIIFTAVAVFFYEHYIILQQQLSMFMDTALFYSCKRDQNKLGKIKIP